MSKFTVRRHHYPNALGGPINEIGISHTYASSDYRTADMDVELELSIEEAYELIECLLKELRTVNES